ncbi:SDR family oxidoreductase [Luteolibacter luteus]|uniref:SDR family oxidoreductase n=1 Tax=Luteolibacter luteus TaxID=2728835 RepID=A0A858RCH8_9BACT|nr:SDR family oxidoreductase [Luteolibacter luteus]QJE94736.1 SDR family oxidoreductase [Luteolibacter luteus]
MIAITGATGQLGRLVLAQLLKTVPADQLVAVVRDSSKAANFAERGVSVRVAAYGDRAALAKAFEGVERVLLISSNELGQRVAQHVSAIEAAKDAGVKQLAYTSVLRADTSTLSVAKEHLETEQALIASGLPYVLLRNGWYTENYLRSLPGVLANGALVGCAGSGRIASAACQDYAEAAAVVLTAPLESGRIYELAGDDAFSLADLAAEISRQTGKQIPYQDLSEPAYVELLLKVGMPQVYAELIADSDRGAAAGDLFDDSRTLSTLIDRPTTPIAETIKMALAR